MSYENFYRIYARNQPWRLAARYGSEDIVAFELLNEIAKVEPELWNSLAAETLKRENRLVHTDMIPLK